MSTVAIITTAALESAPFQIPNGMQLVLQAKGLQGSDTVVVEVVTFTQPPRFPFDACCPPPVQFTEVESAVPLTDCGCGDVTGAVVLTAAKPFVTLKEPAGLHLRARVVAAPDAVVTVSKTETPLRAL